MIERKRERERVIEGKRKKGMIKGRTKNKTDRQERVKERK